MNNEQALRILIADDEKVILNLYSRQLPRRLKAAANAALADLECDLFEDSAPVTPSRPVDVTVCRQGDEAVEHVRHANEAGEPFDVILLDVRMPPGIDGVAAAEAIRAMAPCTPIIFVSGYSDVKQDDLESRVPPPDRRLFLPKPVRMTTLADKIREMVAA